MQQRSRRHNHAVGAVAALRGLLRYKGCLDLVGLLRRAETFERSYCAAGHLLYRCNARTHRLAVEQNRTCPTLGQAAAEFGSTQTKRIAQNVEDWLAGVPRIDRYGAPINSKFVFGHLTSSLRTARWQA